MAATTINQTSAQARSHAEVHAGAVAAARAAVEACGQDDRGACGFAWVEVHPATTSFARWCVGNGHGRRMSRGLSFGGFAFDYRGQNVDVFEAGARAFADVLSQAGINATAHSRLD